METSFYIPINSGSLAHYFSKAIILPAKYFLNKPEDIQNTVGDSILVSKNKWVKNSDCSIEVILTGAEVKELNHISDHFFLYNTPIPISRVKSVCFLDSNQMKTTIWNINNGAGFIPESIVSVELQNNIEPISDSEFKRSYDFKLAPELPEKIKRFDIILGGFAFMRLGGKSFMNYSPNYFPTLSYFNKLVEEQTNNAAKEKGLKFSSKYTGLFSKNESEWTKWQQYIYQNLEPQDIESLASKEGERVEKRLGMLKIDSIKLKPGSHLYELAILATYGDRKTKSTDNLVTDLTNGTIHEEKVEDVSILFGLNNGYSKLRNRYKGSMKDSDVKFKLNSKLDYYIIESIYQFVFNNPKASYSFDYIDNWCPISKPNDIVKDYDTYKILDTLVITKKKQTVLEIFLENYSREIYSIIVKSIDQWLPPFAKNDEKEAILYFEKRLRDVLSTSVVGIQRKIESDCEANFYAQKNKTAESFRNIIDKQRIELSSLKEENERLKMEVKSIIVTEKKPESLQKGDNSESESVKENEKQINVVQKPINDVSDNFESMHLSELKKIAKEIKVKGYNNKKKEELIKLIKETQPTLL